MKKSVGFIFVITLLISMVLVAGRGDTAVSAQTQQPQSSDGGPTIVANSIASGFNNPVAIANADDNRLFIVEQSGVIRIIDTNSSIVSTPFLDITDRVDDGGEQGLLGLAFDPDYANNGYFYVNYNYCTISSCDNGSSATTTLFTRVSRFSVTADPYVADPNSEVNFLEIQQPYGNHNGGDLAFGPDGYLYIGMGDGGSGGDPEMRAQNEENLLGAMLRIDVSAQAGTVPDCGTVVGGGTPPYTIPTNNPYVADADNKCDEIWSIGLRNPWRFSFDAETGDLFIGDVGQSAREEVDFQPANSTGGENYGWGCREGFIAYGGNSGKFPCNDSGIVATMIDPIFDYNRTIGRTVSGGYVYRGSDYPELVGTYIVGDYILSNFWTLEYNDPNWDQTGPFTLGVNNPSTFGEGCDNELYVASYGGTIYQIGTAVPKTPLGTEPILDEFVYLPFVIGGSPLTCN